VLGSNWVKVNGTATVGSTDTAETVEANMKKALASALSTDTDDVEVGVTTARRLEVSGRGLTSTSWLCTWQAITMAAKAVVTDHWNDPDPDKPSMTGKQVFQSEIASVGTVTDLPQPSKKFIAPPVASSKLAADVAAQATTISINSKEGFNVGHHVLIDDGTKSESRTIKSFGAAVANQPVDVNLNHPLTNAYAVGTRVAVTDQAPFVQVAGIATVGNVAPNTDQATVQTNMQSALANTFGTDKNLVNVTVSSARRLSSVGDILNRILGTGWTCKYTVKTENAKTTTIVDDWDTTGKQLFESKLTTAGFTVISVSQPKKQDSVFVAPDSTSPAVTTTGAAVTTTAAR
jgi:2C-methyl-D-erythritol 2,4-cyclodiphosphate synthase